MFNIQRHKWNNPSRRVIKDKSPLNLDPEISPYSFLNTELPFSWNAVKIVWETQKHERPWEIAQPKSYLIFYNHFLLLWRFL